MPDFSHDWEVVVNCFQNCTFVILDTTRELTKREKAGCELLSKLYLCNTGYNYHSLIYFFMNVVNCFQNCTFVILDTTEDLYSPFIQYLR